MSNGRPRRAAKRSSARQVGTRAAVGPAPRRAGGLATTRDQSPRPRRAVNPTTPALSQPVFTTVSRTGAAKAAALTVAALTAMVGAMSAPGLQASYLTATPLASLQQAEQPSDHPIGLATILDHPFGNTVSSTALSVSDYGWADDLIAPMMPSGDIPPTVRVDAQALVAATPWFVSPVAGEPGSAFGARLHPILNYVRMHNGVDMTGGGCGAPIVAAAAGKVVFAGWNGGYGNLVVIDHGIINGHRFITKYGHMSGIGTNVGARVEPGTGIGLVGTTGLSTGCHLHFEVQVDGVYVDPVPYLTGKPFPTPATPIVVNPQLGGNPNRNLGLMTDIKDRIRFCESSHNYTAQNPTSSASGAYQFIDCQGPLVSDRGRS